MASKIKLLIAGLFLSVTYSYAQMNTASPYSRFGLGELVNPGFAASQSMGGTGITLRGPGKINYINPASLSSIDTMSFLFDFGLNYQHTAYSTELYKTQLNNFNIDHVAIGFPVTRWWKAGLAIMPFSRVGYNIKDANLLPVIGVTDFLYEGSGGLSRFAIANAFNLGKELSIGASLNYLFGSLNHQQSVQFPSDPYSGITFTRDNMRVNGMTYNFGLQYQKFFAEKYFVALGATYDNKVNLNSRHSMVKSIYFPGSMITTPDSALVDPSYLLESDTTLGKVTYPAKVGIGLSAGIKDKLIISGEYSTQKWSDALILGESDSLKNSQSMNLGIEFIPGNKESVKKYYRSVSYRLGGYYTKSYLVLRGNQLNDYGITFGAGLPFRGKTSFNLGCVLGQRGTLERDLIKEKYFMINLSITFQDLWFFKTVID